MDGRRSADRRTLRWWVAVRVFHAHDGDWKGGGWSQTVEEFPYEFQARERAAELADRTVFDLYKLVVNPKGGRALLSGEQLVPSDRHLTKAEVRWGSRAARGGEHGRYEVHLAA